MHGRYYVVDEVFVGIMNAELVVGSPMIRKKNLLQLAEGAPAAAWLHSFH